MTPTNKKNTAFVFPLCLIVCSLPFLISAKTGASRVPPEGRRLALLVGISDYENGTNPEDKWHRLNTGRDLENMRYVLETYYGFERAAMRTLCNDQATQDNVSRVFREHLIANAKPGDRIVFYYTGHGFHVPDTSGDEIADGEDEVTVMWVPKDKQSLPANDRRALMYMADDLYQNLLKDLSQKMRAEDGKVRGNITVIFDSCNSGSATKGSLVAKGREWDDKIDGRRAAPFVSSEAASGWLTLGKTQLENVAFIAASQSDQFSYMMPDSIKDGSILTHYLSQFLVNVARDKPDRKITYTDMLQSINPKVRAMGNTQDPQAEGNVGTEIMGDGESVVHQTLPTVRQVQASPLRLELGVGTLHSIGPGSRFDLFRHNTDTKNATNKLGELEITDVRSTTSEGKVMNARAGLKPADYEAAQAVLTKLQFDGEPLKLLLQPRLSAQSPPAPPAKLKLLSDVIAALPFVSRTGVTQDNFAVSMGWCVDETAEVCKGKKDSFFYQRASGRTLSLGSDLDVELLKKRLLAEWRWRRFAELTLPGNPRVRVDLVGKNGESLPRSGSSRIVLRPGDTGTVRVVNNTDTPVFITLLYLKHSGEFIPFPERNEVNGQQIVPADNTPRDLFTFTAKAKELEVEVLRIIATPRPADFTSLTFSEEERKGLKDRGPKNPFEDPLTELMDAKPKSFLLIPAELDRWYTHHVVYEIRPN